MLQIDSNECDGNTANFCEMKSASDILIPIFYNFYLQINYEKHFDSEEWMMIIMHEYYNAQVIRKMLRDQVSHVKSLAISFSGHALHR